LIAFDSMESLTDAGLTVTYDEEAGVITFDWDPETHPEYNSLKNLTSEQFAAMMMGWIDRYEEEHPDQPSNTEIDGEDHTNL
jgi:hypothetical protein